MWKTQLTCLRTCFIPDFFIFSQIKAQHPDACNLKQLGRISLSLPIFMLVMVEVSPIYRTAEEGTDCSKNLFFHDMKLCEIDFIPCPKELYSA